MGRIAAAVLLLFAVACGSDPTPTLAPSATPQPTATPTPIPTPTPTARPPEPVAMVESLVHVVETLDVEQASKFFCGERKEDLLGSLDSGLQELQAMGLNPDELLDGISIAFHDMQYEEKSIDGDEALIHVSGSMSLVFDKEMFRSFVQDALAAAGQTVTEQELDFVLTIFANMAEQGVPIEGDVELIKEGGAWVVCGELDFLYNSDLFQLPLP